MLLFWEWHCLILFFVQMETQSIASKIEIKPGVGRCVTSKRFLKVNFIEFKCLMNTERWFSVESQTCCSRYFWCWITQILFWMFSTEGIIKFLIKKFFSSWNYFWLILGFIRNYLHKMQESFSLFSLCKGKDAIKFNLIRNIFKKKLNNLHSESFECQFLSKQPHGDTK